MHDARKKNPFPVLLLSIVMSHTTQAACDNFTPGNGQTTTCDSLIPNPVTTNIAALVASSDVTINILNGSILGIQRITNPVAISVDSNSQITNQGAVSLTGGGGSGANRGAALLGTGINNQIINDASGIVSTSGAFNDGMAANGSGNTLTNNGRITTTGPNAYGMTASWGQSNTGQANNTLINNGVVITSGTNARSASILGQNGVVRNSGTLMTTGNNSTSVYMQGNNDSLINSGLIHASGAGSEGVFSNTAGANFNASITNLFGGQIISDQDVAVRTLNGATSIINAGLLQGGNGTAINGGNGNVSLILQTGSAIIGVANGGAGNNRVTLEGSGLINNGFTNFQTLYMQGTDWTWIGTGTFANSYLQTGQFRLENSLTGNVNIASGASLLAGNGAHTSITPYSSGPEITVTNAGLIDLTNGIGNGNNTFVIQGNYVGANGVLQLQSVLAADDSPSDRLIIAQGLASGSTNLNIINLSGPGAATTQNGIMVIEAINGANTDKAFNLGGPVAAGPYEYLLFKGGVTANTEENWYLRSTALPIDPLPLPTPGAIRPPDESMIPLYRPETALYSALIPIMYQTSISLLSTFHERRGEESLLVNNKSLHEYWIRGFGKNSRQNWQGTVSPSFDGSLYGFQAGVDLLAKESASNLRNHAGIIAGYSRVTGDINGFALGWENYSVGNVAMNNITLGSYWTVLDFHNGYLDAVIMNNWFDTRAVSSRNVRLDLNNSVFLASLEGGYPVNVFSNIIIEPQAQLIWQNQPLENGIDPFSTLLFQAQNGVTGRLGLRVQNHLETSIGVFQPYIKANLWQNFAEINTVEFNQTNIITQNKLSALQVGGGVVHECSHSIRVFISGDYAFNLNGGMLRTWSGNAGLNISL